MEMHHKLRRDPNWHPNGCNLCGQVGCVHVFLFRLAIGKSRSRRPFFHGREGERKLTLPPTLRPRPLFFILFILKQTKKNKKTQLGHQASVCPNGTVNWRDKFGGEEKWKEHFVLAPAVYASEDPSCSFGNGRRQSFFEQPDGEKAHGGGGCGLRAPRTPARVAAQDPAAVQEAARAWAKQRKESGAAEREPVPPARKGPRASGAAGAEVMATGMPPPPGMPPPQMTMMMMPPPPMPGGGFYPPPQGLYGAPPPPPQTMMPRGPPPQWQQQQWQQQQWQQQQPPLPRQAATSSSSSSAAAAAVPISSKPSRPAAPGSPPPAGWGKAVDSKGRTYYWNKKDKSKVSWKKPAPAEDGG